MTDHWQVIEKALERYRNRMEEVNAMGWYKDSTPTDNEIARIDAALAFVREQRAQLAGLTPDVSEIRNASPAPSLYA